MEERVVGGVTAVMVGRGVLPRILDGTEPSVAVVHQPGSAAIAGRVVAAAEEAGTPVQVRGLPDGDDGKTLAVVEETAEWMARSGVRRDGVLVGVGGGALTDVAGFTAAVFLRGIEARYLPTTMLGAVDAAIGGKTAVNLSGKNLVGTFTHPSRVVVDIEVLESLPAHLLADGFAESLKAGLIRDRDLLELIERDGLEADLEAIVAGAVGVKAGIVDADFRESGERAILNFGHTIGHALETLSGWRHGPSIAVGMVAAAAASQHLLGFSGTDRVKSALRRLELPVEAPPLERAALLGLVALDKKAGVEGLRMVLLEEIGCPVVRAVDTATLDAALEAIGI